MRGRVATNSTRWTGYSCLPALHPPSTTYESHHEPAFVSTELHLYFKKYFKDMSSLFFGGADLYGTLCPPSLSIKHVAKQEHGPCASILYFSACTPCSHESLWLWSLHFSSRRSPLLEPQQLLFRAVTSPEDVWREQMRAMSLPLQLTSFAHS